MGTVAAEKDSMIEEKLNGLDRLEKEAEEEAIKDEVETAVAKKRFRDFPFKLVFVNKEFNKKIEDYDKNKMTLALQERLAPYDSRLVPYSLEYFIVMSDPEGKAKEFIGVFERHPLYKIMMNLADVEAKKSDGGPKVRWWFRKAWNKIFKKGSSTILKNTEQTTESQAQVKPIGQEKSST